MESRKCLRVLNSNVQSQSCLLVATNGSISLNTHGRGKKRKNDENLGSAKSKRRDGIYIDEDKVSKKQIKNVTAATQTDPLPSTSEAPQSTTTPATTASTQETLDMLTSDNPSTKYWEILAEKRKEALEETLAENKELHEKNKKLESEISELKEENKLLEDMVDEAKQLAALVQSITGAEDKAS